MKSLFENTVRHLPKQKISKEDFMFLGYTNSRDVILAVEEGEFRIYSYEFWDLHTILDDGHAEEDWRSEIGDYFENCFDCMDAVTCEYSAPKFTSPDVMGMAKEIVEACDDLEDASYVEDEDGNPKQKLIDFLIHGLAKIDEYKHGVIYAYYK